jgi:hypothetical protein
MRLYSIDDVRVAGRVLDNMDRTADPCVNFQQYACGGWEKETHILDEKPAVKQNDENTEDVMQFFKGKHQRMLRRNFLCPGPSQNINFLRGYIPLTIIATK